MLEMIVAADGNGVIGNAGRLPWRTIPEDMAWFRSNTEGKTLVMGRRTFESIPEPLRGRRVCVITRSMNYKSWAAEILRHPDEVFDLAGNVIICGGVDVYRLFSLAATKVYWTSVRGLFKGDTYFPFPLYQDGLPCLPWSYRSIKVEEHNDCEMYEITRKTL